jgi:peptidoglycan/xylan/chitin deacetylase (PgdA/CDA1 family)
MTTPACTVVYYHYIRDAESTAFPGIKGMSTAAFAAQLDWLQERYRIIDGVTFERAALGQQRLKDATALLTFDDGFVDHYHHGFAELRARGLAGVFFVSDATVGPSPTLLNVHKAHFLLSALGADRLGHELARRLVGLGRNGSDGAAAREGIYRYDHAPEKELKRLLNYELPYELADRLLDELFRLHIGDPVAFARGLYLSADMIAEMARGGMRFGYHSRSHRVLSRLTAAEQERELAGGVDLITRLTGQRTVPFCYPYGLPHTFNRDTVGLLERIGYSIAFSTNRQHAELPVPSRYEVPRFDTRDVGHWAAVNLAEQQVAGSQILDA